MPFAIYVARESDVIAAACARHVWERITARSSIDAPAVPLVELASLPAHLFDGDVFACAKRKAKAKLVRPAPVYVATLADGSVVRLSFWQEVGKPLDLTHGRRLAQLHGVTRVPPELQQWQWVSTPYGMAKRPMLAMGVLRGHAEVNGGRVEDLAWSQAPAPEVAPVASAKPRRKAAAKVVSGLEARLVRALAALMLECEGVDSPAMAEAHEAMAAAGATVQAALAA